MLQLNTLFKHWSYRIIAPGTLLRERYEALKKLLQYDVLCHEEMAELQDLLHDTHREDFARIRVRFTSFSEKVANMISALEAMNPGTYSALKDYHKKFDFYTTFLLAPPGIDFSPPYTLPLAEINKATTGVGNKTRHLALLDNQLGLPVPQGFGLTTSSYYYFIEYNNLRPAIDAELAQLDIQNPQELERISASLKKLIMEADLPPEIEQKILDNYDSWGKQGGSPLLAAVRSSAISEDGINSFAGQYESVINVSRENLVSAYKEVISSKYSPQALFYRITQGLGDEETAMSVLIQEMVSAHASGVLYTGDASGKDTDNSRMYLHAVSGTGDQLVSGIVTPDCILIDKQNQKIIHKNKKNDTQLLKERTITELARFGLEIEKFFGTIQDIEWAVDQNETLYILQARELHITESPAEQIGPELTRELQEIEDNIILEGLETAAGGVAGGCVFHLNNLEDLVSIPNNSVLVTKTSPPDLVKAISRTAAVISEKGSRASHFATVAREFGVPFLTNVEHVFSHFPHGSKITVDGNLGIVISGIHREYITTNQPPKTESPYLRILTEALKFITPLELTDPQGENFTPEGCRSMHDIIRFCHEKALHTMFATARPGTGRGALKLAANIPLDVFLFDVGGGIDSETGQSQQVPLSAVTSVPFNALWKGLSHEDVQWKQKPFDWDAYDRIELSGGIPPKKDSFAFASYAVVGEDYLHFNLRFGYHFTIVDVHCGKTSAKNHCMLRFAGGGGDFEHLSLRINFLGEILERLEFLVEKKGDLLEAKIQNLPRPAMQEKLDTLGRMLGASKLMDMVLRDEAMVKSCVEDFFNGCYSFSEQG